MGLNIGQDTDYGEVLHAFLTLSMKMPGLLLKVGHDNFYSHPFQFIYDHHIPYTARVTDSTDK
jgi:hypothetical protein